MIFLALSILFMSLLAVCLRLGTARGADPLALNLVFRGTAGSLTIAAVLRSVPLSELAASWQIAGNQALLAAVFYWLAGYAAIKAVQLGHLGATWTVTRCAMVLPTTASLLIWHEVPLSPVSSLLVQRLGGIAVTTIAVILLGIDRRRSQVSAASHPDQAKHLGAWFFWLAAAFFGQGGWEICLRATRTLPDHNARLMFVMIVFTGAFVLTIPMVVVMRTPLRRKDLAYGVLAGVVATFASGLRVWALRDLDGVIVFPVTAVSVATLVMLAGRLLWRERIGAWGMAGFFAALAGMLMLTVG